MASATSFYEFKPLDKRGQEFPLVDLKGKVVLVVNTASKCGFTPQYAGLESLYKSVREKHGEDFEILGFPCNQFGGQDPGTDDEIQNFCQVNYGVSFPIMQKTEVKGDNINPLWAWLKHQKKSLGMEMIKWNFEKFLIGRDGQVVGRWASLTKPESLKPTIEEELAKGKGEKVDTKTEPAAAAAAAPATTTTTTTATETPKAETEPTKTEAPQPEASKVDEPKVDEPKVDEPKVEEPKAAEETKTEDVKTTA